MNYWLVTLIFLIRGKSKQNASIRGVILMEKPSPKFGPKILEPGHTVSNKFRHMMGRIKNHAENMDSSVKDL